MAELSLFPVVFLVFYITLSSLAGLGISKQIPWSPSAIRVGLIMAFGLSIGPFLFGLSGVIALWIMPSAKHILHIGCVAALLFILSILNFRKPSVSPVDTTPKTKSTFSWGEKLLLVFLIVLSGVLLHSSCFIPLTQNDSLEYATVGRILYNFRNLGAYPAIAPEATVSGFYGPWTHPPLYPVTIYLMNIIQGHADSPGFMRLISPWFTLTTTFLVFTMGRLFNRFVGLVAATLFLSTPLLFLGANSSLIDPLPVAGIGLLLAIIVGAHDAKGHWKLFWLGLLLGFSLWTHSQAILFIPMLFFVYAAAKGLLQWRTISVHCLFVLTIALIVGIWPYLKNYYIFGTPISDNPAVFALPSLEWKDYFRIARGIDNWSAIIQYGWFKGWFAVESFGLVFWLMLLGFVPFLKNHARLTKSSLFNSILKPFSDVNTLAPHIMIALIYFGGVVLSTIIGTTLMIKNERYFLVILPSICIIAAYGIDYFINNPAYFRNSTITLIQSVTFFYCLLLFFQFSLVFWNRYGGYYDKEVKISLGSHDLTLDAPSNSIKAPFSAGKKHYAFHDNFAIDTKHNTLIVAPERDYLLQWPNIAAMKYLEAKTDRDALILSLRPADMYYSDRKMVSYLDPRLIPFYQEQNLESAYHILKNLGITHIQVSDYAVPPFYNSLLQKILIRQDLTKLVFSAEGNQIYRLTNSDVRGLRSTEFDLSPQLISWTRFTNLILGGRKTLKSLFANHHLFMGTSESTTRGMLKLFHRDWSHVLFNGVGDKKTGLPSTFLPSKGTQEYHLHLQIAGNGHLKFYLLQYDQNGQILRHRYRGANMMIRLGDLCLTMEKKQHSDFYRRFKTLPETRFIRIGIEHMGNSNIDIQKAKIVMVENAFS